VIATVRGESIDVDAAQRRLIDSFVNCELNILTPFKPHDRLGNGTVDKPAFVDIIRRLPIDLSAPKLRAVAGALASGDGGIIYGDFAHTVHARRGIDYSDTKNSVLAKLRNFLIAKERRLSPVLSA
jgi:hypothetical protein